MRFAEILRQVADQIESQEEPANAIGPIEPVVAPELEVQVDPVAPISAELSDIIRLAGNEDRVNTTIAQPASDILPINPTMVPPLQQTIELQKQQGGKASPVINQILKHHNDNTGSFAGEHPEQSVYHNTPNKPGEYVGAGGSVTESKKPISTQGANKPWHKI